MNHFAFLLILIFEITEQFIFVILHNERTNEASFVGQFDDAANSKPPY